MKNLITFLRSFFSMGILGLIFFLIVCVVFLGAVVALRNFDTFNVAWARADVLNVLEDQVSSALHEMQLNELYFVFASRYGTPLTDEAVEMLNYTAEINATLDDLIAHGHFTSRLQYSEIDIARLEYFRTQLDEHQQTFVEMGRAYSRDNPQLVIELMASALEENADLQETLGALIASVDADRTATSQAFMIEITRTIQSIGVAIVVLLILGLWGYWAIARLVQPLLGLANMVIAIGGDQYRPELAERVIKTPGPAGRLASSLDAFAKYVDQRDAGFKQEIDHLRQQLFESRRRRLKLAQPAQDRK